MTMSYAADRDRSCSLAELSDRRDHAAVDEQVGAGDKLASRLSRKLTAARHAAGVVMLCSLALDRARRAPRAACAERFDVSES
jgi:hypothetical protein